MTDKKSEDPYDDVYGMLQSLGLIQNNEELVPHGQRKCPICGQAMIVHREFGIHIDVCDKHGVWLDQGELQALLTRAKKPELLEAVKQARREGKEDGLAFGWLSLWME